MPPFLPRALDALTADLAGAVGASTPGNRPAGALAGLLASVERRLAERIGVHAWTSTTDALPTDTGMVLAWHRDQRYVVLEFVPAGGADALAGTTGWFTLECEPVRTDEVLAWRPLPPAFPDVR